MKRTLLILVGLSLTTFALADDDNLLPANRPNFSSNGEVVPYKMTILETGATYQRSGSSLNFSGIEGELRVGFQKGWEFDFFIPNYVSGASPRGWNDSGVGLIRALPSIGKWNMVFSVGATLPTGQSDLTSGAINPNAYFSTDCDLGHDLQFTNTAYITWNHNGGSFFPSYANAAMVSKDLGKGLGAFVELYTTAAPGTTTGQVVNIGYTFAHNASQQVDFHFGRNIVAGSDTNWFVGFGYSQKLGK